MILVAVGSLAAIAAVAWGTAARREPLPVGVVIITLDTTRADRLSPYGFMDVSLPHLERLAREGVIFDQASSVAPLTLPAHTTLFTGLLPPTHRVHDNADTALADDKTTLAEVLQAQGFRTAAFVGSVVLAPDRGLKQGFEVYSSVSTAAADPRPRRQRPANEVMDEAVPWLKTVGDSRFFLWTHLYDPHRPYDPPEPYRSRYAHNPYVGEIAFADAQIGRLIDALEEQHLLDRTVVIVTADHGESLGSHGERDHGIFVYEDVIRVPLIIRAPGLKHTRVGQVVRLMDIMPTLLDFLDLPATPADGVSLVDVIRGRERDLELEAYAESIYPLRRGWSPLRALRAGRYKLIEAPRPELYDLEADPFEEHNIYDRRRGTADDLAKRLEAIGTAGALTATGPDATPELQARLASLGYLGSPGHRASDRWHLPDPKDCIGELDDTMRRPGGLHCGQPPQRTSDLRSR